MSDEKPKKSLIAEAEEKILDFWAKNDIFEKTLAKEAPKGEFVFYEGPPTANGKPGIHHLEARVFKDLIPRYKTMQGFHVRRKGGWDTHGLPVELQVEKQLGLKSKKEIEAYGIEKFNEECKESVWEYLDVWNKFTHRIGYWVDQQNPYVTYKNDYIESLWNVLKTVADKDLLYKDYKVVPWCPRCGTALSSHELAQGYSDVKDLSVTVEFRLKNNRNTSFLAWTTTPWTLPGNVALAVGEKISYVEIEKKDMGVGEAVRFILAKDRLEAVLGDDEYTIIKEVVGKELVGIEYEPLYSFITDANPENIGNAHQVYSADFVTTEDGTGIVHTAVMYGQDDFELGTKVGLPKYHLVDETGHFIAGMDFLSGKFVKDEAVAVDIIKDLAKKELLFKKEKYEHSYPFCWRCKTPLIYYARDSWYIRMSSLRDKLVKENEDINWIPTHIKDGRFGEWLREIKDWAISRERYWGTPLPIWTVKQKNADNTQTNAEKVIVIGSVAELKKHTKKSGNKYLVMRHGEAEHNISNTLSSDDLVPADLTEKGKVEVENQIENLRAKKIDFIFHSPLIRTTNTARILAKALGLSTEQVVPDDRLKEINAGEFNGKSITEYRGFFQQFADRLDKTPKGGENLIDLKRRVGEFLYELENKYQGKNILIVTHEYNLWTMFGVIGGADGQHLIKLKDHEDFMATGEIRDLSFIPLPHNKNYELDLHRPFIDEITLIDEKGNELMRVKEVMDVWFDSGAMPFAQDHYPFENQTWVDDQGYPADYIAEAIDQTRGWFYTLHAIGTLLGRGKAYKNVICLGHILDEEGKKMSKSLGNIIDPWEMIDKYGVDALRLWMYSVNQPGDSKNFDEKTVGEVVRKVFNLLINVTAFYELNATTEVVANSKSKNILDRWIIARLNELISNGTDYLEQYRIFEATRLIRDFVDDLSTWYVRRSRDRFKEASTDREAALATTKFVLLELSKYLAPFVPFYAETLYQKGKSDSDPESVHLCDWPKAGKVDEKVLEQMSETRKMVSLGLEARARAGIKIRQPLSKLIIKSQKSKVEDQYLSLIRDELNVKEVVIGEKIDEEVELDLEITPELKEEGQVRELIRQIQDLRKKKGLQPSDVVTMSVSAQDEAKDFIERNKDMISAQTQLKDIVFGDKEGEDVDLEGLKLRIGI